LNLIVFLKHQRRNPSCLPVLSLACARVPTPDLAQSAFMSLGRSGSGWARFGSSSQALPRHPLLRSTTVYIFPLRPADHSALNSSMLIPEASAGWQRDPLTPTTRCRIEYGRMKSTARAPTAHPPIPANKQNISLKRQHWASVAHAADAPPQGPPTRAGNLTFTALAGHHESVWWNIGPGTFS